MSVIDEIKSRINIVDLVSETVQLRRSGKNYAGFCPFHANTRTPSFYVFPETASWHCFGQCGEGGDIFSFLMKKEGLDFNEALKRLAERAGVELKPRTPQDMVRVEEYERLRKLLEEAAAFYQQQLLNPASQTGKGSGEALAYLQRRGVKDITIEAFGLGYAPDTWEALTEHFLKRGYSQQDLLEAGLVVQSESGKLHDRFRHRLMFPIRDERGHIVGFGGRVLDPEGIPKYLNSPQTALFDKSRLLYGLDLARKAIRTRDEVVVVEGYLDVILPHQAGFNHVVSPMGTALSEHQLRLLKRFSKRIILALDRDAAGGKAILRGLQVARRTLEHENEVVFDARGLMGYEARLQADIRVAVLPEGMDPDEVVLHDPQEWERILKEAQPIVIHVMHALAAEKDVNDPKVKDEIAKQVLPLIEDVPSSVEREAYRQRLARLLKVDERALLTPTRVSSRRSIVSSLSSPYRRQKPVPLSQGRSSSAPSDASHLLETHILGVLLRRPDLLYRIDRSLQGMDLPRLSRQDFQRAAYQQIFDLLAASLQQDETEPLYDVLNRLPPFLSEVADALLVATQKLDPYAEGVLEDLLRGLLDLRLRVLKLYKMQLDYQVIEVQEQGDLKAVQYQQALLQCTQAINKITLARGVFTGRN